jgi:glutaredoxin
LVDRFFLRKLSCKKVFRDLSKNFILVNFYVFVICKVLFQKRDISSKSPVFETPNRPAGEDITPTCNWQLRLNRRQVFTMNSNLLKLPRYGILTAALIISLVMVLFTHSQGSNNLVIHFFTSAHCPQCVEAEKFLDAMQLKYPQLTVKTYEARKDPQNAKLFTKLAQTYNVRMLATPAIFIGGFQPVIGYQSDEITGKIIESRIRYCLENGFTDPMNRISGVWPGLSETGFIRNLLAAGIEPIHPESFEQSGESSLPEEPDENILVIPFLGTVNTSEIGYLPLFTVVIAGLDSFNPCAFFVLLTLLGMLIHIRSKKRMLLVGGVFIFFSGLIYFLFMAAWLNLFMYIGELAVITIIAGVAALSMGLINIKSFLYLTREYHCLFQRMQNRGCIKE